MQAVFGVGIYNRYSRIDKTNNCEQRSAFMSSDPGSDTLILQTDKSLLNIDISNQIWIVITFYRLTETVHTDKSFLHLVKSNLDCNYVFPIH